MTSQETKNTALYELELLLVPRDGSEPVAVTTTPSMWALADEWADTLRVGPAPHSEWWLGRKMADAAALQAAQASSLVRPGAISLELIAEMNNLYKVVDQDEDGGEGADDAGNAPAPA